MRRVDRPPALPGDITCQMLDHNGLRLCYRTALAKCPLCVLCLAGVAASHGRDDLFYADGRYKESPADLAALVEFGRSVGFEFKQ